MKDKIKEILDIFTKYKDDWYSCEYKLKPKQCAILYDYITNLQKENEILKIECSQLENIDYLEEINRERTLRKLNDGIKDNYRSKIDKAIENCKKSIESINQKLQDDKTIKVIDGKVVNMNEYQIVRLKAIRMKCKELLSILGGKENE